MKVRDCLMQYPGFNNRPAVTHLRVFEHEGSTVAIVGELDDNPSTSITNQIEVVVELLRKRYGRAVIVIEHYPPGRALQPEPTWLTVVDGEDPRCPDWRDLSQADVELLIGEPVDVWPSGDYRSAHLIKSGTSPA